MRNVAFQVRQAYWKSKARILIEWLLKRLGIFVGDTIETVKDGTNLIAWLMPLSVFIFVLACLFRWVWW